MRTPFEKLMERADILFTVDPHSQVTMGELAREWDEPVERIMDAIDAVRVMHGERTYVSAEAPTKFRDETGRCTICGRLECRYPAGQSCFAHAMED